MKNITDILGFGISSDLNLITDKYIYVIIDSGLTTTLYGDLQYSPEVDNLLTVAIKSASKVLSSDARPNHIIVAVPAKKVPKVIFDQIILLAKELKQYAESLELTLESMFDIKGLWLHGCKAELINTFEEGGIFNKSYTHQQIDLSRKPLSELITYDNITFGHWLQAPYEVADREYFTSMPTEQDLVNWASQYTYATGKEIDVKISNNRDVNEANIFEELGI